MRKKHSFIFLLIMMFAITVILGACSEKEPKSITVTADGRILEENEDGEDTKDQSEKYTDSQLMEIGKEYSVKENVSFELFKVSSSEAFTSYLGYTTIYYKAREGQKYIDTILSLKNNSNSEIGPDLFSVDFVDDNGKSYGQGTIALENNMNTSTFNIDTDWGLKHTIAPSAEGKVHLGSTVPLETKNGNIYATIGGTTYKIPYDSSKNISAAQELTLGETYKIDGCGSFTISKMMYAESQILPSNSTGTGSVLTIKESENIALAVYLNLTNELAEKISVRSLLWGNAYFSDGNLYAGTDFLENQNGTGFAQRFISNSIESSETSSAVYVFEMPKEYMNKPVTLCFYMNGKEYTYSYNP